MTNQFRGISTARFTNRGTRIIINRSLEMLKFYKKVKKVEKNLLNPEAEPQIEEEAILDEHGNEIYEPYLIYDNYVYVVADFTRYQTTSIPE